MNPGERPVRVGARDTWLSAPCSRALPFRRTSPSATAGPAQAFSRRRPRQVQRVDSRVNVRWASVPVGRFLTR